MPPEWFDLLARLPPDVQPTRRPLVDDTGQTSPEAAAVAGWSSLVLELSAGAAGLRVLVVTVDRDDTILSASDMVHSVQTAQSGEPGTMRQESLGGRFEPDGSFRGTRWSGTARVSSGNAEPDWELTPSAPRHDEVARLRELAADLVRRS